MQNLSSTIPARTIGMAFGGGFRIPSREESGVGWARSRFLRNLLVIGRLRIRSLLSHDQSNKGVVVRRSYVAYQEPTVALQVNGGRERIPPPSAGSVQEGATWVPLGATKCHRVPRQWHP